MTVDERDIVAEARAIVPTLNWAPPEILRGMLEAYDEARAEIPRLRAEVAAEIVRLREELEMVSAIAERVALDRNALRLEALEVVGPFAEAKSCLDNTFPDHGEIWETSAAMMIEARHLRNAAKFLAKHGGK